LYPILLESCGGALCKEHSEDEKAEMMKENELAGRIQKEIKSISQKQKEEFSTDRFEKLYLVQKQLAHPF